MHTVISREEAGAKGYTTYFTGEPCKRGHVAKRYVSNTGCLECMSRFKRAAAKNPHSHDLVPYAPQAMLWRSKRLTPEHLAKLDTYIQQAVDAFCTHVLPPVCKVCNGTRYVPVGAGSGGEWELCKACEVPEPSTAASVPKGTTYE